LEPGSNAPPSAGGSTSENKKLVLLRGKVKPGFLFSAGAKQPSVNKLLGKMLGQVVSGNIYQAGLTKDRDKF
jgi:hypothetical protein